MPVTDNFSYWNRGSGRMTVEIKSKSCDRAGIRTCDPWTCSQTRYRFAVEPGYDSDIIPCHAEGIKKPCPLLIFSQSDYSIQIDDANSHTLWQTVQLQISWLKPTDLDLHCLQRQGMYRFSRIRLNWSGYALLGIQYVNLYQQPGSSNLIGWKLEVGMALIPSAWQGLRRLRTEIVPKINYVKYVYHGDA